MIGSRIWVEIFKAYGVEVIFGVPGDTGIAFYGALHFNNGTFGWIKALQRLQCNAKYFSVDLNADDPARVAEGFGLKVLRIETPEALRRGLKAAFSSAQPVFVDKRPEPEVENLPPVFNWLKVAESQ